jgi:HEAT repeat protein
MLMLVPPLGTAPLLTVESEELLRETATRAADADVRSTAQLALGAAVQGLARGAPERARALVGWFARELRAAAADPDATRQWLLVLGNTGHPDALEPVLACLSLPAVELRTAAVGSLRFIPGPRAAEALLRALREDKAAEVRAEAIWALRFRAPSAAAAAAAGATLAGDPAQSVRLAAVEFLQNARSAFPEAAAALARAAREDGDEKVRKAAAVEPQPNE